MISAQRIDEENEKWKERERDKMMKRNKWIYDSKGEKKIEKEKEKMATQR